jgi:hypothetical protein
MASIKLFGQISKAERQDDGTLMVRGVASSEAVDSAGETIRADAIKAAIPDYMAFGAVREMHQPIAAGVALKCEVAKDGRTHIEARIVDPVTIKKVEAGCLKGFSVGGRGTERDSLDKTIITGIRLTEISLVDRPCNPEAVISLCKVEDDEEEERGARGGGGQGRADSSSGESDAEDDSDAKGEEKGKEKDDEDDEGDEDSEKLAKLATAHGQALARILSLESKLAKTQRELDAHNSKPAPPKGAVRAVSKGEDALGRADAETELKKRADALDAMPPVQRAAALVQLIHNAHSGRR